MVHLTVLHTALLESRPLELPIEMVATVFEHMTESDVFIGVLKIVEDGPPQHHINQISKPVEIRRGADDDPAGPQNLPKTLEYDVTRYRQVLDDFGKENEVEPSDERRLGFAQVPLSRFHTVPGHVRQMRPGEVGHNTAVTPQLHRHKSQLSSSHVEDINRMRRSQGGKSPHTFFVTRAIPQIVCPSTELHLILADKVFIHRVEIVGLPRACHQMMLLLCGDFVIVCRLEAAL
jgi:hypothetical protein